MAGKILDATKPQKVSYCLAEHLKILQIKTNVRRPGVGRFQPEPEKTDPVAIVGFGPSLVETWEKIRDFKYVITCSGAHKFLVERGVVGEKVPERAHHHCEVDPRPHKVKLVGQPQKGTRYYVASCCHPDLYDHLQGYDVRLWHVFDPTEEGQRAIPHGDAQATGGCDVGLRAMVLAGALGFRDLHIFAFDGSFRDDGKTSHADAHPMGYVAKDRCEYPPGSGRWWFTTPAFLEAARQTWHELDLMPHVRTTWYGDGLRQEMAKHYVPNHPKGEMQGQYVIVKDPLISEEYRKLNTDLHQRNAAYGAGGDRHAKLVLDLVAALHKQSGQMPGVLDYGAGKGALQRALPWPIWQYDPCVPEIAEMPRPAEVVICSDVLEHIEPGRLDFVLGDLVRVTKQVLYVTVNTGPAVKTLSDGRNTHLIQKDAKWWAKKLGAYFDIGRIWRYPIKGARYEDVHFMLGRKVPPKRRWHVLEDLVKANGWTQGAEIGVKEGKTLLHLLKDCPALNMLGVDLFEARPGLEKEGGESHSDVPWPEVYAGLQKMVADAYPGRAVLAKGDSLEIARVVPNGSLDFVFVDADHREAAVRADIAAWRPKVKPGGWLLGHDYQERFPGVQKAVDELCPGRQKFPDSVWGAAV